MPKPFGVDFEGWLKNRCRLERKDYSKKRWQQLPFLAGLPPRSGPHPSPRVDIHDLKERKSAAHRDLYKDCEGNIYVKPKGGGGPGGPTGHNINDH